MELNKGDLFSVVGVTNPEFEAGDDGPLKALALSNYMLGSGKILRLIEQSGDLLACQVEYSGKSSDSMLQALLGDVAKSGQRLLLCMKNLELWPVAESFLKALTPEPSPMIDRRGGPSMMELEALMNIMKSGPRPKSPFGL